MDEHQVANTALMLYTATRESVPIDKLAAFDEENKERMETLEKHVARA